jgi:DUF917 family protein
MQLGREDLEAAAVGGGVLGGGGGGSMTDGLRLGDAALEAGSPTLVSLDSLPPDGWVATVSLVGAQAASTAHVEPEDHLRAWQMLTELAGRPLCGIITCENGAAATVNGWFQSARLGVPVVDAPADGRAHPTGDMGSLGLERDPAYVSLQAAAGGDRERDRYLEQQVRGPLAATNRLVRAAAEAAGGLVAVARNPVTAAYLEEHAAKGAITQALALGRWLREDRHRGADAVAGRLCEQLGATIITSGPIDAVELQTRGGYDIGLARIGDVELTFWNEYMTCERLAARLATFPDLIVTIDADTALPLTTAELAAGRRIIVLTAPASALKLGAGLRVRSNLAAIEPAVGKEILRYLPEPC